MKAWWSLLALAACGRLDFAPLDAAAIDTPIDSPIDAPPPPPGMISIPVTNPTTFDFQAGTPWKRATLTRAFYLDRDEVTVGRWKAWLDAGLPVPCATGTCALDPTAHYPTMQWDASWNAAAQTNNFATNCSTPWGINGSTYPIGDPTFPINCMTWMQAVAFCAWDGGKRLPTMVEWNYEARGGDHRRYVWGDTAPDCSHATYDSGAPSYCGFPRAVGSAPDGTSVHGARDMNGSVWEWGWDATNTGVLVNGVGAPDEVTDGAVDYTGIAVADASMASHVLLGGEWGEAIDNLDLIDGTHHAPGGAWPATNALTPIGLRCAKTAP